MADASGQRPTRKKRQESGEVYIAYGYTIPTPQNVSLNASKTAGKVAEASIDRAYGIVENSSFWM